MLEGKAKEIYTQGQIGILKDLPRQTASVRSVLADLGTASDEDMRKHFKRGQTKTIQERLATLAALGQADMLDDGRYAA